MKSRRFLAFASAIAATSVNICHGFVPFVNRGHKHSVSSSRALFPVQARSNKIVNQRRTTLKIASISRSSAHNKPQNQNNEFTTADIDEALGSQQQRTQNQQDIIHTILDDGNGHINADLARSIWEWENSLLLKQQQKEKQRNGNLDDTDVIENSFPAAQLKFSTRAGLRLVEEIAREYIDLAPTPYTSESKSLSYSDLIQEGVVALMRAMAQYDPSSSSTDNTFENYAKIEIQNAMSKAAVADTSSRLTIRLPAHVLSALAQSNKAQVIISKRLNYEREPTLQEVADEIGISVEKLSFYNLLARGDASDSGIGNALIGGISVEWVEEEAADEDARVQLQQEQEPILPDLSNNHSVDKNDDAIVVPLLSDFVADEENPTPEDIALTDMIRHDIGEFLSRTLDERELQIVRMRFGLGTAMNNRSLEEVGKMLGISASRARQLERRALDKLRTSFSNDYIGVYLDDDHSEEVSV